MTAADFARISAAEPYIPKGMFYSEAFLFLRECERAGVTKIVESGVKCGVSTRLLRAAFGGAMVSVDQVPCAVPPGVLFVLGDARVVLPALLAGATPLRVGVLIDGPKGAAALRLKDRCLGFPCVRVVAVHDVKPGLGETFHGHDPEFRSAAGDELDALITHPYKQKYPNGPGLGVWVKEVSR